MKKIILLFLITAVSAFAGSSLTTYIDYNSIGLIKELNLKSHINNRIINLGEITSGSFEEDGHVLELKDFSPYEFEVENGDTDFNVITIIGDKTIKVGGIFANGYNKKYNINNLISLLGTPTKINFNIGIYGLQKFDYNNISFIYNKEFDAYNADELLTSFTNLIESQITNKTDKDKYLLKVFFIKELISYTKNIHNSIENSMQPFNNNVLKEGYFGKFDTILNRLRTLGDSTATVNTWFSWLTLKTYSQNGNIITKKTNSIPILCYWWGICESEETIDISKKVPLIDMYDMINNQRVSKAKAEDYITNLVFAWNKSNQNVAETITVFNNLKNNIAIKSNLNIINKYGISNGKIIYYNYSLGERISEENDTKYLSFGLIKDVAIGIVNFNSINLLSLDTYNVNAKNDVEKTSAKAFSLSDYYKDDPRIKSNLYNIWIRKPSDIEPVNNNLLSETNYYIPHFNMDKSTEYQVLYDMLDKGNNITTLIRKEDNEMLGLFFVDTSFNINNNLNGDATEIYKTNFENSTPNRQSNFYRKSSDFNINPDGVEMDSIYPMQMKSIVLDYFPTNNQNASLKYFGPVYQNQKLFVEKYDQLAVDANNEIALDENNNTIVLNTTYGCGYQLEVPDVNTYNYLVLSTTSYHLMENEIANVTMFSKRDDPTMIDDSVIEQKEIKEYQDTDPVPIQLNFYKKLGTDIVTEEQAINSCLDSMTFTKSTEELVTIADEYQLDNQDTGDVVEDATTSEITEAEEKDYYNSIEYLNDIKDMLIDFYNAESRIFPHSGLLTTTTNTIEGNTIYTNKDNTLEKQFLDFNTNGNQNGISLSNDWKMKACFSNCIPYNLNY